MSSVPTSAGEMRGASTSLLGWCRRALAAIGAMVIRQVSEISYLIGTLVSLLLAAMRTSSWPRTTRAVLVRQILFTGVESFGFICFIAVIAGMSLVLQAQVWLTKFGLSDRVGPLLVAVVFRELAPLVVTFVIIARSGNAVATELGQMRIHGEVRALEIQGIYPGTYLVLPRVLGLTASIVCLTIFFCAISLASGCIFGLLLQEQSGTAGNLVGSITGAIGPADVLNVLAKTVVPGLFVGIISCTEGLSVGRSATEVPQAASRAMKRSFIWLFVISAMVSVMTYL
jgi:phospholipid/cholesterol/gamma-HCH transport system permease protein